MASGGLSKAVKVTMGRAMRETGAALKEASGVEVRDLWVTFRTTSRSFLRARLDVSLLEMGARSLLLLYLLYTCVHFTDFYKTPATHDVAWSKAVCDE